MRRTTLDCLSPLAIASGQCSQSPFTLSRSNPHGLALVVSDCGFDGNLGNLFGSTAPTSRCASLPCISCVDFEGEPSISSSIT